MRGQVSAPSSLPVGSGSSGPDVPDSVRPEHPAGRSGPVRPLTASGRSLMQSYVTMPLYGPKGVFLNPGPLTKPALYHRIEQFLGDRS